MLPANLVTVVKAKRASLLASGQIDLPLTSAAYTANGYGDIFVEKAFGIFFTVIPRHDGTGLLSVMAAPEHLETMKSFVAAAEANAVAHV